MIPLLLPSLCLASDANPHFWPFFGALPGLFHMGHLKAVRRDDSWESSPWAWAAKHGLLQPLCMDTNNPFPQRTADCFLNLRGVFLWCPWEEAWVSMAVVNLKPHKTWVILFFTRLWVFIQTPVLLARCGVASAPRGLEEALHWHHVGACPGSSVERGDGGHAHAVQSWPTAEIFFCAFITPSRGRAKTTTKLEELSLTAAVTGRQEREVVPSPHPKIGWCLGS